MLTVREKVAVSVGICQPVIENVFDFNEKNEGVPILYSSWVFNTK